MSGFFKAENTITSEEAARNFETVLDMVDKYHIVLITRDGKPDIVAMGFHYFVEQFGPFLPEDEYAKLKAMDRYGEAIECEQAESTTGSDNNAHRSADGEE